MIGQKIYIALLLLSLIGFVLFFPVRLAEKDCCLGDQWRIFGNEYHHKLERMDHGDHQAMPLVHCYFFPFGVLWWSSLALGWLSIRRLTNKNEKGQDEDFSQHSPVD